MDIPNIGRYAIVADPQGASLSVIQMAKPMPLQDTTKAGAFTWNELLTSDYEAAFRFYNALFGWKKQSELDMGPMGKYLIYGLDSREDAILRKAFSPADLTRRVRDVLDGTSDRTRS